MRVEGVPLYTRRPWWHGSGSYFLIILVVIVASVAIHTTLKREYQEKLDHQRDQVAALQIKMEQLEHERGILQEALQRRIKEVSDLMEKIDSMKPAIQPTEAEKQLLEKLVTAEARGEGYKGMLAVANVVINRATDPRYPDTIHGVIDQAGQFCPVSTGSIHAMVPEDTARQAVADALQGYRAVTDDALFFYNPAIVSRGHWIRTRPTVTDIGNHRFAK